MMFLGLDFVNNTPVMHIKDKNKKRIPVTELFVAAKLQIFYLIPAIHYLAVDNGLFNFVNVAK